MEVLAGIKTVKTTTKLIFSLPHRVMKPVESKYLRYSSNNNQNLQ